ncbi:MAG: D-2-hydroxyacid dehydrogenase [Clostridia bacterium]|nr:D-2-hydroxyacid dehydrogenase [Clostridia bacterium]
MENKINITAVDVCTVSYGDIDLSEIAALGNARFYDVLTPEELKMAAADADVLLVNKADVTADLVAACPNLKYVGTFSTGYNNLDIPALKERGIVCCNVPGYSTHAVCQQVFALLFMFEGATDKYVRSVAQGDWIKSHTFCYMPWAMREVYGKTFGVYGYGSIDRAVAKAAEAFGMRVIVHSRTKPDGCPYEYVDSDRIFSESDYLSFHCPLNSRTAGIVNARTLSLMKPEAVIINTARGGLIDENELAKALNSGKLRGALLDVLTKEPMRADNPLMGAANCYMTPHISWGAKETRERLVHIVAQNLRCYLNGKPQNLIF